MAEIQIRLDDWQKNAGCVGFINIVGEDHVQLTEYGFSFDSKVLEDFVTKYFDYLIETYKPTLSWYKIVSYKDTLEKHERENFENFKENDLDKLNTYITDVCKRYLTSASYKASYPLIQNDFDILEAGKQSKAIGKLRKKETFEEKKSEILVEVKAAYARIKQIIAYCESPDGRKYLAAKNVIYTIVKHAWDSVSFLNPQTKEKDVYVDFQNYFVAPVLDYLESDWSKYKLKCCACDNPVKNASETLSFLNKTGFDVNRKNSHAWDFVNDLIICPVCKLIYACIPAGFTYVYSQGMFVNANSSMQELLRVNNLIKMEVLTLNQESIREVNTYSALVRAFQKQDRDRFSLQSEDIQIVRYQKETYRFNILSKKILKILNQSEAELSQLLNAWVKENGETYSLYQKVVEKLFNNENMLTLIHKLLVYKATKTENPGYQIRHIHALIQINQHFLGGILMINEITQEEIKKIKGAAWYFKKGYDNPNKVSGISYKLLNALKIGNRDEFMNVILNCYAYLNQQVPQFFNRVFENDESFKTVGYSFVAGIIGPMEMNENGGKA
ncbi:type I-B CRISPR-associated protein Cas8b1/Cst1 [Vagococcus lutrae]|uniref:type I-B CRISPR-associated protein Cas8b1/Cst1 n=1 Tax=Vagococcus lutrae TaxID=81947 RepID=UPI002A833214|nr:type I-B CRISPR-associated protein Cas8b1/Cst1 [Vagococcus lutrae]MDY3705997.1 type I-B CRISPR-associated protein Cas8b1/Cst1 [Vagococcus lutrae]